VAPLGEGPLAEVHVRTLRRAAALVGGEQELALRIQVTPSHLILWLAGVAVPPPDVFLRAVDIVMDHVQPASVERTP
jgi:DNA-binding transcriptional regulator YdaS (Cro superfamily)